MNQTELKQRTRQFAIDVLRLCEGLPANGKNKVISNQLSRSATSVAANYRAALRGCSHKAFAHKIKIVEEEADESLFWIELLAETGHSNDPRIIALQKEADQLTAIFTAISTTIRKNRKRIQSKPT